MVITAILWGATPIVEKIGLSKVDPLIGVTIRSTIVTAGLLLITLGMGKGKALMEIDGKGVLLFGASGLMAGILAMWTYYTALKMGTTSKIVPIVASYPLITSILSVVILREGLTLQRIMGTALIALGIWFVK